MSVVARMHVAVGLFLLMFATPWAHAVPDEVPSASDAKAWLAYPKGSTSLGRTNDGQLIGAVELPRRGEGYEVLSMSVGRKTNFGTAEMIAAIQRATRSVRAVHPGSVLGIGNLGFEDGRKIPWSVSHQAGRDADLGMFATTLEGAPVDTKGPMAFHAFDADGIATGPGGRKVRFDVARNLALVSALVEDREARVQYIFVAAWLKAKLLAEATRAKLPADTIARLGEVLHQPTDSNPHADHFHVRLFCTIEDRQFGCINRGPVRGWVDPGDREHDEAARRVASILRLEGKGAEALRLRALERLGRMVATGELDAIAASLSRSKKERKAALAALIEIGDARAAEAIVKVMPTVEDPGWATELFAAIPELDAASLVPLASRVLAAGGDPLLGGLLHPKAKKAADKVRASAIAVLRDHGRSEHVATLLAVGGRGTEPAVLDALAHRTCRKLKSLAAYAEWYDHHRDAPELEWISEGLAPVVVGKGGSWPRGFRSRDTVGRLIAKLDAAPWIRACAWRGLVALTGHDEDPGLRPPGRNVKHWKSWWADNQDASSLP